MCHRSASFSVTYTASRAAQFTAAGAFVGFKGPSRAHHPVDWHLLDNIAALVDSGPTDRILLREDTVTASARSTADGPGMAYLVDTLRSRVERELGPEIATAGFITNPAHAFSAPWSK